MEAIEFITLNDNLPFAVALGVMAMVGAISALGLDFEQADGADGIDLPLLDWLNPGRMPMLAGLTVLLCVYGVLGLAGQQAFMALAGHTADALPAGVAALLPTALATRPLNRGLARIMPRDETSAITVHQLIGRRGRIEIGTARAGFPARARFVDDHGQMHMLMVEPSDAAKELPMDEEVLLVSIDGGIGRAVAVEPTPFIQV